MIFVLQVSIFSGRLFCDYFANQVASMKILVANLAPKVVVAWRVERSFFSQGLSADALSSNFILHWWNFVILVADWTKDTFSKRNFVRILFLESVQNLDNGKINNFRSLIQRTDRGYGRSNVPIKLGKTNCIIYQVSRICHIELVKNVHETALSHSIDAVVSNGRPSLQRWHFNIPVWRQRNTVTS